LILDIVCHAQKGFRISLFDNYFFLNNGILLIVLQLKIAKMII